MSDSHEGHEHSGAVDGHTGSAADIHLPPNSFVPVAVAIALAITFVGFLEQIRSVAGPWVWVLGLVLLLGSLVAWMRAARTEFRELPESARH